MPPHRNWLQCDAGEREVEEDSLHSGPGDWEVSKPLLMVRKMKIMRMLTFKLFAPCWNWSRLSAALRGTCRRSSRGVSIEVWDFSISIQWYWNHNLNTHETSHIYKISSINSSWMQKPWTAQKRFFSWDNWPWLSISMTRSNIISCWFEQWEFQHHDNVTTDHGGVHFNDQVLRDVGRLVMLCAKAKARVPSSWWQSWLWWRSWQIRE